MKKLILATLVLVLSFSRALAIDRDASMIDSIGIEAATYDAVDILAVAATSEIALQTIHEEWAVLVGLCAGLASADSGDESTLWSVEGGLKYYATEMTSFTLLGGYTENGSAYDLDAFGLEFGAKHRFVLIDEVLSPFVVGTAALQRAEWTAQTGATDDFSQCILTVCLGFDVLLQKNLAMVFQAGLSQSESLNGGGQGHHADGWIGSAAMAYYWK